MFSYGAGAGCTAGVEKRTTPDDEVATPPIPTIGFSLKKNTLTRGVGRMMILLIMIIIIIIITIIVIIVIIVGIILIPIPTDRTAVTFPRAARVTPGRESEDYY